MTTPAAKHTLALGLALSLCASAAGAAGLNLAWDKCLSEGGASAKTFSCAVNSDYSDVVASFTAGQPHPKFVALVAMLDIQSTVKTLPAWWEFFNTGTCRQSNFLVTFSYRELPRLMCEDPFDGSGYGGIGSYATPDHPLNTFDGGPNNARLTVGVAMASPRNLASGTEYYAFILRLDHESSSGPGACEGCSTPVCLTLTQVDVYDDSPADPDGQVIHEAPPESITQQARNQMITWQDSGGNCQPKVRNKTWGQLKSLYR